MAATKEKNDKEVAETAAPVEPAAPQLKLSTFVAPATLLGLKYFDIGMSSLSTALNLFVLFNSEL
jgi:hypothetical protein